METNPEGAGDHHSSEDAPGSLTLGGAVSLGTGVMIGAGIFALTGQTARLRLLPGVTPASGFQHRL